MPDTLIALRDDEVFEIFSQDDQDKLDALATHVNMQDHNNYHDLIMLAVGNYLKDIVEGRMPRPAGDYKFSLHFADPAATNLEDWAKEMGVSQMDFVMAAVDTYQKMLRAVRNDQQIELVTPPQQERREPFEMSWP
jgi:hypothetical protein